MPAAPTGAMPKSPQSVIQWVWIRPLVLRPQMKKVANRTQKVQLPEASRKAASGERNSVSRPRSWGGGGVTAASPKRGRPRSEGRSRTRSSTSTSAASSPTTTTHMARRQPWRSVMAASMGRKTSCPVAVLAVSSPTTSPRRWANQRVATVAPRTRAIMPEPVPHSTPQSSRSCQTSVMANEAVMPATIRSSAAATTGRMPKRLSSAAAKGAIRPNSIRRTARAEEMSAVAQPNSCCRGTIITPGALSDPAVASMVRKVAATTAQP